MTDFCRITGKSRALPKPHYFPLIPHMSLADVNKLKNCRITCKSEGQAKHAFLPLILPKKKKKSKADNDLERQHHYQPHNAGDHHPSEALLCKITQKCTCMGGAVPEYPPLPQGAASSQDAHGRGEGHFQHEKGCFFYNHATTEMISSGKEEATNLLDCAVHRVDSKSGLHPLVRQLSLCATLDSICEATDLIEPQTGPGSSKAQASEVLWVVGGFCDMGNGVLVPLVCQISAQDLCIHQDPPGGETQHGFGHELGGTENFEGEPSAGNMTPAVKTDTTKGAPTQVPKTTETNSSQHAEKLYAAEGVNENILNPAEDFKETKSSDIINAENKGQHGPNISQGQDEKVQVNSSTVGNEILQHNMGAFSEFTQDPSQQTGSQDQMPHEEMGQKSQNTGIESSTTKGSFVDLESAFPNGSLSFKEDSSSGSTALLTPGDDSSSSTLISGRDGKTTLADSSTQIQEGKAVASGGSQDVPTNSEKENIYHFGNNESELNEGDLHMNLDLELTNDVDAGVILLEKHELLDLLTPQAEIAGSLFPVEKNEEHDGNNFQDEQEQGRCNPLKKSNTSKKLLEMMKASSFNISKDSDDDRNTAASSDELGDEEPLDRVCTFMPNDEQTEDECFQLPVISKNMLEQYLEGLDYTGNRFMSLMWSETPTVGNSRAISEEQGDEFTGSSLATEESGFGEGGRYATKNNTPEMSSPRAKNNKFGFLQRGTPGSFDQDDIFGPRPSGVGTPDSSAATSGVESLVASQHQEVNASDEFCSASSTTKPAATLVKTKELHTPKVEREELPSEQVIPLSPKFQVRFNAITDGN